MLIISYGNLQILNVYKNVIGIIYNNTLLKYTSGTWNRIDVKSATINFNGEFFFDLLGLFITLKIAFYVSNNMLTSAWSPRGEESSIALLSYKF